MGCPTDEELDCLDKSHAAQLLEGIVGRENIKLDEPMYRHTSFKVGGPADILVFPHSAEEICSIIGLCRRQGMPFFVMGNGSNLVVRDKGIRGVVIKLFDNLNAYSVDGNVIEAQAGLLLSVLSKTALRHGLAGLEFAEGIPGTVGGAVTMNAGAYGGEMKDVVIRTECIDSSGNIITIEGDEHQFGYRTSVLQKEGIIAVRTWMKLHEDDPDLIKARMDDFNRRRKEKQPLNMPSAGSVFRRPAGHYTGKLIEDCGLKGFRIGGAEVSTKHCGFIVNAGGASALDIVSLIKHIQDTIKERFGVELQTEVKVIGEE